jgi:hypothetical protein
MCAYLIFEFYSWVWPEGGSHDVTLNSWPQIQRFVDCDNYVGGEKVMIVATIYGFKTLIPLLTFVYWKIHHIANLVTSFITNNLNL